MEEKKATYSSIVFRFVDTQISRLEGFMLAVSVVLMAANTIAGVISRFVFNYSFSFTDELNSIFIILVTFSGISYAARQGRHIRMSAIFDTFPDWLRKGFTIIISAITAAVMFFLCYYAVEYIQTLMQRGRIMPALGIPIWWAYVWVPVGFFVTGVQYVLTVVKNLREKDIYLSTDMLDGYGDIDADIEV
ncbi:TRAP transporter small permease [Sulfurospirillum sp. T05]|uniref:TRAP transporter small permease n=2 Tax=Sulfurospirillum tamanense TaxID=2813362 RepID=A0ABS2WQ98_9BACT|nr:TRAP transporter small permease [Sulfurospirillum tamanensis]MBN2963399.1 TRAP transporter small permease [Sulfurospirillum tamanensis]